MSTTFLITRNKCLTQHRDFMIIDYQTFVCTQAHSEYLYACAVHMQLQMHEFFKFNPALR